MEKNKVKVSVVMPFYNCENFIEEAVESILNQTYTNFEFIIINDSSIDKSFEKIKKYLNDKRIIYIENKEQKKIVYNLNKWIELSSWEYIVRMDWDDISFLDRIEKQVNFLEKNKDISIVWWQVLIINENWKKIWNMNKPLVNNDILKNYLLYSPFNHPSVCYRKKIIKKYNYREEFLYLEDYDLWLRLISDWNKWANLNSQVLKYRRHGNNTWDNNKKIAKKSFFLRKKIIKDFNIKVSIKTYIWMYTHLLLWYLFSRKAILKLEYILKKIIIKWK